MLLSRFTCTRNSFCSNKRTRYNHFIFFVPHFLRISVCVSDCMCSQSDGSTFFFKFEITIIELFLRELLSLA